MDLFDENGLPRLQDYENYSIRGLLNTFKFNHIDAPSDGTTIKVFWPTKILEAILSRDRIAIALRNDYQTADTVLGWSSGHRSNSYLKVMALLCLLEHESEIGLWIDSRISDASFPFRLKGERLCDRKGTPLEFLRGWKKFECKSFVAKQWAVSVPYFELDRHGRAKHENFVASTMLPWRKLVPEDRLGWDVSGRTEGGYGIVHGVMMAKSSHAFDSVLRSLGLKPNGFALKKLKRSAPDDVNTELIEQYEFEVAMLKRFGHYSQQHLIFLLTSFTIKNELCFLFPHAECDLYSYWDKNITLRGGPDYMEWTFQQMCGLVTAVDRLHTRDIPLDDGVKGYFRHGDIRPANILWFESDTDSNGILVLADMGVAAFNRTYSRSKKPGRYVAQISGHHPPEMVMADGVVNPTFDIWSLGCVFLDMIAWALGGNTWLYAFRKARVDEQSLLVWSDTFYRIVKDEGKGDKYDAILKGSVNEWIKKMYDHRNCTPTFKNVLETIQKKMVVVSRNKRARANDLVSIFDNISNDPSITMSTANEADSMEEIEIAPELLHFLRTEGYNKTDDHPIKSMKTITDEETHREIPLSSADSRHHHPVDPETETHGQEDTSSERSVTSEIPVPRPPQGIQRQLWFFDSFTYRPHDFPTLVDDIIYLLPFRRRLIFWLAPPVSTGKKRVWWRCTCGEPLYDDIPIAVQTLQRQLEDNAQTRTGEEQRNPDREQVRPLMQWLPSWNGILNPIETIATALRNVFESTGTDNVLPVHNTNVSTVSNPQDDREQDNLHLLLCIDKSRMTSVKQECLGTIGDDKELFTFLRGQYESVRPRGRSWFTLRALRTIRIVKFDMDANMVPDVYACPRDGSHNATCICLPPVKRIESGEYRCSPQPKQEPEEGKHPAVKPSHLKHYFDGRHPMKVIDRRCLDQIPKRVKGRLAVLPGAPAVGWGLHFEEGWSFNAIFIVILLFVVPGMGLLIGPAITSRDYRQVASAIISMASLVVPLVLFLRDKDK